MTEASFVQKYYVKDFSKVQYILFVKPGRKIVDPAIKDPESIKYTPDAAIEYRL